MAFQIAAIGLAGFTLYNFVNADIDNAWQQPTSYEKILRAKESQVRMKVNLQKSLIEPKQHLKVKYGEMFAGDKYTTYRKAKTRLQMESNHPLERKLAKKELIHKNLRVGSGATSGGRLHVIQNV